MGTDMKHQPSWVPIVAALIAAGGAMAICGVPIISRLLDIYLPAPTPIASTNPNVALATSTPVIAPIQPTTAGQPSTIPTVLLPSPTYTVVPVLPTQRPTRFNVRIGENRSIPSGDWTWVCTGDFSITLTDGSKKALYDVGVSNTGLTLILQPNSRVLLDGPFDMPQGTPVGDCYPYTQNEKDSAISGAVEAQFNMGCGSKCQFVNVIELDKDGNQTNNYWLPRQP